MKLYKVIKGDAATLALSELDSFKKAFGSNKIWGLTPEFFDNGRFVYAKVAEESTRDGKRYWAKLIRTNSGAHQTSIGLLLAGQELKQFDSFKRALNYLNDWGKAHL